MTKPLTTQPSHLPQRSSRLPKCDEEFERMLDLCDGVEGCLAGGRVVYGEEDEEIEMFRRYVRGAVVDYAVVLKFGGMGPSRATSVREGRVRAEETIGWLKERSQRSARLKALVRLEFELRGYLDSREEILDNPPVQNFSCMPTNYSGDRQSLSKRLSRG